MNFQELSVINYREKNRQRDYKKASSSLRNDLWPPKTSGVVLNHSRERHKPSWAKVFIEPLNQSPLNHHGQNSGSGHCRDQPKMFSHDNKVSQHQANLPQVWFAWRGRTLCLLSFYLPIRSLFISENFLKIVDNKKLSGDHIQFNWSKWEKKKILDKKMSRIGKEDTLFAVLRQAK